VLSKGRKVVRLQNPRGADCKLTILWQFKDGTSGGFVFCYGAARAADTIPILGSPGILPLPPAPAIPCERGSATRARGRKSKLGIVAMHGLEILIPGPANFFAGYS
jgi:hypothetical protein